MSDAGFTYHREEHSRGRVSIENADVVLAMNLREADLGVQIAADGRLWLCVNGIAFVRFSPHPDGEMTRKKSET